ncbi:hypothetical protein O3Q52_15935 [Streptomyces sp. ActVer]|uniref:hypothetical protein n=1 Tax=Streptomyces sp. ActVer TaxID=3014558 RepID=UPI0022B4D9C5|nr:hypothetical protein [Streptomyces sp. ActVer]MCZ4509660.1 hypothetical protein [Streptomyces sp. ActVer]
MPHTSTAADHWNAFAKAVAEVLVADPSASRETLLDALRRCAETLTETTAYGERYESDPDEVLYLVKRAGTELEFAIRAAARPPATAGTEPAGQKGGTGAAPRTSGEGTDIGTGTESPDVNATRSEPQVTATRPEPHPVTTPTGPGPVAVDLEGRCAARLLELGDELHRVHGRYVGTWQRRPPGPVTGKEMAGSWESLHIALLRLPEKDVATWRDKFTRTARECLGTAAAPSAEPEDHPVPVLGDLHKGVVLPLALTTERALRRAAAEAPRDVLEALRIGDVMTEDVHGPRLQWAARAGQALRLAELDPELRAVLEPGGTPAALRHERRDKYRNALVTSLKTAASALSGGADWTPSTQLGPALELDLVLGGLHHEPAAAAPDSWWWRWRREVSGILQPLARKADHELVFDETHTWHEPELSTFTSNNVRGDKSRDEQLVHWVLQTPLRRRGGKGTEFPGRVVSRPEPPNPGGL